MASNVLRLFDVMYRLPHPRAVSPSCTPAFRVLAFSLAALACLAGTASTASGQDVRILQTKLFTNSIDAAQKVLEQYGVYENPSEKARLTEISYRLAAAAGFSDYPFSFYLIDMPEPNAFALPGGQIFVTRGMLNLGLTDDMLACLVGHEIAHVTHSHGTRMQRRATLLSVLSQVLTLGVLVGADGGPENPRDPYGARYSGSRRGSLVEGAMATSLVLSELLLRNYGREFEDEADLTGQRLAAAAGYDPAGAQELWQLMIARIPQSNAYGYWRTHPFSDQRMRAAEVRAADLKIDETPKPPGDYRTLTQKVLLDFSMRPDLSPELRQFLESSALDAWPKGRQAEEIRMRQLQKERDAEFVRRDVERDYGKIIRAYEAALEEVRLLTPDSPFLDTLEAEVQTLRETSAALEDKALAIWKDGIYQTPFLELLLSNYPDNTHAAEIHLALGNAYARVGRQADAVSQYLQANLSGPESKPGQQALEGLKNLAPSLDRLAALHQLSVESGDETLRQLAADRLRQRVGSFTDLEAGAEYLHRYPDAEHAEAVRARIEKLADNLYGEVILYQGIGDHVKALERIQQILAHAPTSGAAELLREKAVLEGSSLQK